MMFNAERGELGFGVRSRLGGEQRHCYKTVFCGIEPPKYFVTDNSICESQVPPDARFYVCQQAPAGYTFRSIKRKLGRTDQTRKLIKPLQRRKGERRERRGRRGEGKPGVYLWNNPLSFLSSPPLVFFSGWKSLTAEELAV